MDREQEIQTAFKLWKELVEMEYYLRGNYGHEFYKLIENNPSCRPPGVRLDDLIPF